MTLGTVNLKEALGHMAEGALDLAYKKLTEFPPDYATIVKSSATEINLTGNKLAEIPECAFPSSLKILRVTGNELIELPEDVSEYPMLEQVHAGANCIEAVNFLFNSNSLRLANLSYNCVRNLPSFVVNPQLLKLTVLDLKHNNLEHVERTVKLLRQFPLLKSLCLFGNPLVLFPEYRSFCLQRLPGLIEFDTEPVPEDLGEKVTFVEAQHAVFVKLTIDNVVPTLPPPPPAPEEEEGAAEEAAAPPPAKGKEPPKKGEPAPEEEEKPKTTFHLEFVIFDEKHETAKFSLPEEQPEEDGAPAGKGKAPPPPEEEEKEPDYPVVKYMTWPYKAMTRDLLRDGIMVALVRIDPPPEPEPEPEPEEGAEGEAAAEEAPAEPPAGEAEPGPPPPPPEPIRTVAGTAKVKFHSLLNGKDTSASVDVVFYPEPAIFNERDHYTPAKGQNLEPAGTCTVTLNLYEQEPVQESPEPEAEAEPEA